ncbi:Serine/threonine-protein phosphatase 6 regulatory ankyrin repeat subunit C [Colletotrichum tropicale]|nr:Serine/threonine-protein phosphatase 6 regulatory ankyrin repeat subunit C [Colletotrichum tropicale]
MSVASIASPEIWLGIGYYVDSFHELAALARVNRMLYGIFQVELYCQAVGESCSEITVLAAAKGNLDTLKVAAAFGADMNRVYATPYPIWNSDGSREPIRIPLEQCWATPLHLAVQYGHEEVVRWLMHVQKVKVNSPGRFLCPCMPAIVYLGSNYNGPRNTIGAWSSYPVWTPLHLAICQNHASIARELLENGGAHDTLIARENLPPFENGAWKVLSVPDQPYRPQFYARDHWKSVRNVKLPHIAALSGSEAIMTLVVRDFGGDVNAADASAATPLHYAIIEKDEMMIRHLLSLGADPDCQQNYFQQSMPTGGMRLGALDFALRFEPRLASILLEHGASVWNPSPRSGLIESSLKNIICYHDANGVPLDLRLLLRLTREQERRRSLSTWAAFEFRLAEEEIQATFFRACQSLAFGIQDLEAFINDGELDLGSTPMTQNMAGAMALPAETWLQVAQFSERRDLAALARTNRRLHSLINRELYRTAMEENMYPLTLGAVKAGNLDTLKVAAAYGADLEVAFPQPFCDQVLGIWDRAHHIDRGPDMDEEDKEHDWAWAAPLHVAVMQGRYEIVEWLIEQGVNLENPG